MELFGLSVGNIGNIGGWSFGVLMLLATARMVFTGALVTRREADDLRADRDAWRAAATVAAERAGVQAEQLGDIVRSVETFETFVRALPQPGQRRAGGR